MSRFYSFASGLIEVGFRALNLDVRPVGDQHIPQDGPAILAVNHIGYLDFAFAALAPPRPRRPVHFLARDDFFSNPVLGFLLRRLGTIPVDVYGDPLAAMAAAKDALEDGELVGVHPEGTISPSFVPRRARSGTIRLAWETGAPVVPVALWGSQRLLTKDRPARLTRGIHILVRYGEPYHPEPGVPAARRSKELMDRITALLELNWRDYPIRPSAPDDWWLPAQLGGSAPTPEEAEERLRRQAEQRQQARRAADG